MPESDYMQGDPDRQAIQVPFSDDQKEPANDNAALLDDEGKPNESPEEKVTRKRKRQERLQTLLAEGKQSKEELSRMREEQDTLKQQLAELRGYVAANQNNKRDETKGEDPYKTRLDAVYEKQRNAYAAAQAEIKAGTFDEKRSRYYEQVAQEVEEEKIRIHTEKAIAAREPDRQREQAQNYWVQRFPDVYRNPNAYNYAEATFRQRQALGEQVSQQMVEQVMEDAMTRFKLGPKAAPSASDRARLSGLPASGSGGGGSSRSEGGISMTAEMRRMAVAAYGDLSEAEAIKKWANGPGKRLREKKVL